MFPIDGDTKAVAEKRRRETKHGTIHVEAFCLMRYATDDESFVEWIWNSRDGVTPFIVHSEDNREMQHVQWHRDRYLPNYVPEVGSRVFVDLTKERAEEYAIAHVAVAWDQARGEFPAMKHRFKSREDAIRLLVMGMMTEGAPDVRVVTEEMHAEFAHRRRDQQQSKQREGENE